MNAKEYLEAERNKKLAAAEAITAKAEGESRSLASTESDEIKSILADVSAIDVKIAEMEEQAAIRKSIRQLQGPVNVPGEKVKASTIGEAFVASDAYKALRENDGLKGARWTTGPIEIDGYKAEVPLATLTTGNSDVVAPQIQGGIQANPFQRLTVASLIPSGTTNSNSVRSIVEQSFADSDGSVNGADTVLETGEKPYSRLRLEEVDEPVRKIATILPVSDEMLEDIPALRSYLDGRLRLFVQHAEEDQLLNGSGTAPDLSGFLDRDIQTGTQASLGGTAHDAVHAAITAIRTVAFVEPDGFIVHPSDWEIFRLAKDANEQYYGGGPFTGAYGNGGLASNSLWGLPAVVTSAIAEGTVLVGAFRSASQIFRKGGLTVEASNSHEDFFRRNLTAIRAEERLALAVYRPDAFYAVTSVQAES